MDALEMQALLIRHSAAMREVNHTDLAGREELLYFVIAPTPALRAASLEQAEEQGVGLLARTVAARTPRARRRRVASAPPPTTGIVWASR